MAKTAKQVAKAVLTEEQRVARTTRRRNKRAQLREMNKVYMGELSVSRVPNATRSGKTPNPADPRTSIKSLANTKCGAEWVLKALHPNGESMSFKPKVADGAASESVMMERRDEFVLNKPVGLASETWTVVVVQLPVLCRNLLALAGDPSIMNQNNLLSATDLLLRQAWDSSLRSPSWLTVNVGTTAAPINVYATVMQNQNMDADLFSPTAGEAGVAQFTDVFKTIRRCYCGLTLDFDCNQLTSKGRVTSGQFASPKEIRVHTTNATVTEPGTGTTTTTGTVVATSTNTYSVGRLPLENQEIVQQDSKRREAECVSGEYAPMRIWQPDVPFTPATDARPLFPADRDASVTEVPLGPANIWLEGWGTYVTRWEGMDQTSSIRIKRTEGLELCTGLDSPYGPFLSEACPRDERALSIVSEFSRVEPHAYDADYNEKNGMISEIIQGLGNAIGSLGIPVVSNIAQTIGNIVGTVGGIIGI